jgi:glutathione synthase/RimK-type ligase-like ATP-grasp enzyme/uncharacterized protein (UPF0248 family)
MTPIHELLARIRWDAAFAKGRFALGYWDRVARRVLHVDLRDIAWDADNPTFFDLVDEDGVVHAIPFHRVREVWRDGELVWCRHPPGDRAGCGPRPALSPPARQAYCGGRTPFREGLHVASCPDAAAAVPAGRPPPAGDPAFRREATAMNILVVVHNVRDWPLDVPGIRVVPARAYLTDPAWGETRHARVFNLCKSYRYQSLGYYVSLLAEARGHRPLPRAHTLEDLQSRGLVRLLAQDLDEAMQRSLAPIKGERFELSIYFGRNLARRHADLSRRLFNLIPAPLLRARFERHGPQWQLKGVGPIAASDIPAAHQAFVIQAATDYFSGHGPRRRPGSRYDLAILHDPDNPEPPSNPRAMAKFEKAALAAGLEPRRITRADFGRLAAFDALFIRDTTFADHYTYRFSRRAQAEGLVVIDDPDSILKCNNKVYVAELLARHRLPTPRTLVVHRGNMQRIVPELGLPCVLKKPDSSFSLGVTKAETEVELKTKVGALLAQSELIIAQEWLPTDFDWRVGVLDRRVLFVCRYYMVPGHWQIIRHGAEGQDYVEGPTVAVPVEAAPAAVLKLALRAANLIGDGFYGVDIKQAGRRLAVIEINDNPNVDAGNEDGAVKDALYREVMAVFRRRIQSRERGAAP